MAKGPPPEKVPEGQWEPANEKTMVSLGYFVQAWSLIESTMEVAIGKQLALPPLESSMITAGLQFRGKASLLLCLLERNSKKNRATIDAIKESMNITDRNDILHSVAGGSSTHIWFNRRKTDLKYSSKIVPYDAEKLLTLALRCSDISSKIMKNLGISKADYLLFFQESHNKSNNI
jgi:hypothetical protein